MNLEKTSNSPPPYLTTNQAAQALRCSDDTIRTWAKTGRILSTRTATNRLQIPVSEIERITRQVIEAQS